MSQTLPRVVKLGSIRNYRHGAAPIPWGRRFSFAGRFFPLMATSPTPGKPHIDDQLDTSRAVSMGEDGHPLGYVPAEDAWYGHATGPNGICHRVRICLKSGHVKLCHPKLPAGGRPIRKSLSASDWGFAERPLLVAIIKRVGGGDAASAKTEPAGGKADTGKAPGYGETGASGDRWITVHPNGPSAEGHPVKIEPNHDGTWRITGGAGGALNGLKIQHLKSPHEYRQLAAQKRDERRLAAAAKDDESRAAVLARHRDELARESLETGQTFHPDAFHAEAQRRADEELTKRDAVRQEAAVELKSAAHDAERGLIESVAKAQGWDESAISLNDEQRQAAAKAAEAELLDRTPDLKNDPVRLQAKVERAVQRVEALHHQALLTRAREVLDNHRAIILAAHDQLSEGALGEIALGDLVKETLGGAGKGYQANLAAEALERGVGGEAVKAKAGENQYQNLLEKKEGDTEATQAAQEAIQRMHAGAARSRAAVDKAKAKLGEAGASLDTVKALDAAPKGDVAGSAELLAKAKKLDAAARGAKKTAKAIAAGEADDLATLPTAAVVQGHEISHEEAMSRVVQDLAESERQRATSALNRAYNEQDALQPVRVHQLAGHNAFFGNVGQILAAEGMPLKAPDPLTADILGPAGTAAVFAHALRVGSAGEDGAINKASVGAVSKALKEQHIDTQVALCDKAVEHSNELFGMAESIGAGLAGNIESVDGLLDGLSQNQKRLQLIKQGREVVGVAMGRMEAAAALNEALMRSAPRDEQVSLGACSLREAHQKAAAIGLTQPDQYDDHGTLVTPGQFHVANDGKNSILQIHPAGLDALAGSLRDTPAHLERVKTAEAIKAGEHDEADWLPAGFSRRPAVDVSQVGDFAVGGDTAPFVLEGAASADNIAGQLKDHIAQRIEAGQDPVAIASTLRSEAFKSANVPKEKQAAYNEAINAVLPPLNSVRDADAAKAHVEAQRQAMADMHAAWLHRQVKSGALSSAEASVHRQTLPQDWKTRDLAYQVALQDPRLQHAFSGVGELDAAGRRAVRDYAYEHIFNLDPKKADEPITPLDPDERRAWEGWKKLAAEAPDPYRAIQDHWRQTDEGEGGGLFGDAPEPHAFATVDLSDDDAVLKAARDNARALGYVPERRVTDLKADLKAGQYSDVVPELEVTDDNPAHVAARDARRRIKGALRVHAFGNMLASPNLAEKAVSEPGQHFNPENVKTAGARWGDYVRDMGGESRAFRTVQEKMRGDFAGRFAKGYQQLHGKPFQTVPVALTHADAHAVASLSPEKRLEQQANKSREAALVRKREGGGFAAEGEGAVANKLEAQQQANLLGPALFGAETGKTDTQELDTHRLSLGAAAEGMVKAMLPKISLRKGAVAAGDIDMSSAEGVKRQRAVKLLEATGSLLGTLGTGAGKTSVALSAHTHLAAAGKAKRTIMAVPSAVQENFGTEAARFYDPTSEHFPSWHAEPGASREDRHAAYHRDSGHDIVVVTQQAFRDDLEHALAVHKFDGDREAANRYLSTAPRHEREAAMKAAVDAMGWDFDTSVIDEGHNLLNRKGKADSGMSNAIRAFTANSKYHLNMSADPVKNDASESFSALQSVAPGRYLDDADPRARDAAGNPAPGVVTKSEFMRRYMVNTPAATEALQREMAPFQYAARIDPDVTTTYGDKKPLALPDHQKAAYDAVTTAYNRARAARVRGTVDVDAMRSLSPASFDGVAPSEHEKVAKSLSKSLGILRDSAYDRVVNYHPDGAKLRELEKHLRDMPPSDHPTVIFAHNHESVAQIQAKCEALGLRHGTITGKMNGRQKEAVRAGFSPQWDAQAGRYVSEPQHDVLICSDAAAVGMNAQRGTHLIQYDTPHTAMTHEQRMARIRRIGQRHGVTLRTLSTDTPYEQARRERLERKGALREALTAPTEQIDDSGLAHRIRRERDAAVAGYIADRPADVEVKKTAARFIMKAARHNPQARATAPQGKYKAGQFVPTDKAQAAAQYFNTHLLGKTFRHEATGYQWRAHPSAFVKLVCGGVPGQKGKGGVKNPAAMVQLFEEVLDGSRKADAVPGFNPVRAAGLRFIPQTITRPDEIYVQPDEDNSGNHRATFVKRIREGVHTYWVGIQVANFNPDTYEHPLRPLSYQVYETPDALVTDGKVLRWTKDGGFTDENDKALQKEIRKALDGSWFEEPAIPTGLQPPYPPNDRGRFEPIPPFAPDCTSAVLYQVDVAPAGTVPPRGGLQVLAQSTGAGVRFIAKTADCPRCEVCGEMLDLHDDDKDLNGLCYGCTVKEGGGDTVARKGLPKGTWSSPELSGDGGQGWHCPWCNEVNCSDHPESDRTCFKCKGKVNVVDLGDSPSGKEIWRVIPISKTLHSGMLRSIKERGGPVPEEDCPHCGAVMERDSEGPGEAKCNSCGKPWPHGPEAWAAAANSPEGIITQMAAVEAKQANKPRFIIKAHATGYPLQGRRKFRGLDISIEQRKGGVRSGMGADGKPWRVKMTAPYGYIRMTESSADHDHVDCFIGPNEDACFVYVINTNNPKTGKFDEQKCMLGFDSAEAAKACFLDNYTSTDFFGDMFALEFEDFKEKALATLAKGGGIIRKSLSEAEQKECDAETERIRESAKTAEAKKPHKFKPAKWTHANGHPRCLICGDEQPIGGRCNMPSEWYEKQTENEPVDLGGDTEIAKSARRPFLVAILKHLFDGRPVARHELPAEVTGPYHLSGGTGSSHRGARRAPGAPEKQLGLYQPVPAGAKAPDPASVPPRPAGYVPPISQRRLLEPVPAKPAVKPVVHSASSGTPEHNSHMSELKPELAHGPAPAIEAVCRELGYSHTRTGSEHGATVHNYAAERPRAAAWAVARKLARSGVPVKVAQSKLGIAALRTTSTPHHVIVFTTPKED